MECIIQLLTYADSEENISPALFEPGDNLDCLDVILGKKRDLSFLNIMRILKKMRKGFYPLAWLNCDNIEELSEIFHIINVARWEDNSSSNEYLEQRIKDLNLSEEEIEKVRDSEKKFDLFADFDAYYWDFKTYFNVDLLYEDVNFVQVGWGLGAIACKEDSLLSARIMARSFKYKPKVHSKEYAKAMMEQKKVYSYSQFSDVNLDILMEGGKTIGERGRGNSKDKG